MRKSFFSWGREDDKDTRIINYTCKIDGSIKKFTSKDEVSATTLAWLSRAKIDNVELVDNEWHLKLSE